VDNAQCWKAHCTCYNLSWYAIVTVGVTPSMCSPTQCVVSSPSVWSALASWPTLNLCRLYLVILGHSLGCIWATCYVQDETVPWVNSEERELSGVAWSCIHAWTWWVIGRYWVRWWWLGQVVMTGSGWDDCVRLVWLCQVVMTGSGWDDWVRSWWLGQVVMTWSGRDDWVRSWWLGQVVMTVSGRDDWVRLWWLGQVVMTGSGCDDWVWSWWLGQVVMTGSGCDDWVRLWWLGQVAMTGSGWDDWIRLSKIWSYLRNDTCYTRRYCGTLIGSHIIS